ncbi:hypothetical protein ACFPU1_03330 [Thalassorhabdus alkalitolerans]|uniref:Immunity protein 17 n=1 Tax=Thalassorhabdus alkalitolerans TaxID=2282697 RepID=A0ABW0YHK8_9BACI|nr:hypothetical protein [Thalassobacillus sp. C254]
MDLSIYAYIFAIILGIIIWSGKTPFLIYGFVEEEGDQGRWLGIKVSRYTISRIVGGIVFLIGAINIVVRVI